MALWELDEFKPPQFLGFVRNVPAPPAFAGTRWLPNLTISDLEFEYILGANRKQVMAHVMGFDGEAPIHGRPGLGERVAGELPPIKRKARIGEKEIIRFLQPRSGSADVDAAISSVYNLTAELLDSVQSRLEWLRMQALSEKTVVYNEGGVIFEFDFGLKPEYRIDLVTGLDGAGTNVAPQTGPRLSDTANATPIAFLQYICDKIQQETGTRPAEWVISAKTMGYLLRNVSIRDLIRGTGAPTAVLTPGELTTAFSLYNLPTPVLYDVFVARENADGTYTDVRTMAENKSFFTPGGSVGNTLLGPTAESRVLFGTPLSTAAPGVWAETYATNEPPAEWIKAAAVGFPSMPDANRIGQATLY